MDKPKKKIRNIGIGLRLDLLQILLAIIVFFLMYNGKGEVAVYLFILAAFVAFLDALLAKIRNKASQLRSILDPFANKILINLTAIALFINGSFPFWVLVLYVAKDLLIVIGSVYLLIKNSKTVFRTNAIDKIAVFMQVFTLFAVLTGRLDYILIWISVVLMTISFITSFFRSGIRVVRHKTELEEISFRKLFKLPDVFTLLNVSMGLLAILLVISDRYYFAITALILAVVLDYLDGRVARMIGREGDFGKQLDSLADTISFGVAPAIFGFTLIQTKFAVIVFALFLFAGVLRLARYNIIEFNGEFAGMPITVNGLVIPLVYILGVPAKAYPYIYLFLAILMVSPLKFKKRF